jgi:hypothetical protein
LKNHFGGGQRKQFKILAQLPLENNGYFRKLKEIEENED